MKIMDLSDCPQAMVDGLLCRIPFFKELQSQDVSQYDLLLSYSCIVELEPGEVIMRRGDKGSWLYCLAKGELAVYLNNPHLGEPLNLITPGEVFGDLALLCGYERKATVAAQKGGKKVVLFATNFKPFGDINDCSTVSLKTKLIIYRTMVHSIRWRVEIKKMEQRDNSLLQELRKARPYSGEKGSKEELQSLFMQARILASILDRWNGGEEVAENPITTDAP